MADDNSTVASQRKGRRLRRRRRHRRRKTKQPEPVDSISSLPDVILQHILSFIPTKFAIKTSLLSKRWRHVWCDTPSLSLDADTQEAASINETLKRYKAPKIMSFNLYTCTNNNVLDVDRWIEFAISRNVENMSLEFLLTEFFYNNCSASWTSLKKLSLRSCNLLDESMAEILSGCPVLESLTLYHCNMLRVLDLSKSLRLRTLEVDGHICVPGITLIVAPHIYCLILKNSHLPCTLVDVSSLTEAKLDICITTLEINIKDVFFQVMVLKMLEKLQNVEKLTFRGIFFQVKTLTIETEIFQYVIPGIERLLQNSPDLKKLTVRLRTCNSIPGWYLDNYLNSQDLNTDQCWRSKDGVFWNKSRWDVELEHVVSFMELMLKNTKTLEKMVVRFEDCYVKFKELVPTLSNKNNVPIVLSTKPTKIDVSGES